MAASFLHIPKFCPPLGFLDFWTFLPESSSQSVLTAGFIYELIRQK